MPLQQRLVALILAGPDDQQLLPDADEQMASQQTNLYYLVVKWCQCSTNIRCCWISSSINLKAA